MEKNHILRLRMLTNQLLDTIDEIEADRVVPMEDVAKQEIVDAPKDLPTMWELDLDEEAPEVERSKWNQGQSLAKKLENLGM